MHRLTGKTKVLGLWALLAAVFLPLETKAISLLPQCAESGNCGVTDILIVLVNAAEFLLGISGAVALLFFVYGGFTMLTSAGRSGEVDKGKTILRNAVIGIAIIFLSGVIVRFTTQALTGGTSKIPTVGESCEANGLYVSIPAGFTDKTRPSETFVGEQVMCIKKDNCADLNAKLEARNRNEAGKFECIAVDFELQVGSGKVQAGSCVRGLCPSRKAGYACCLCTNEEGKIVTCPASARE